MLPSLMSTLSWSDLRMPLSTRGPATALSDFASTLLSSDDFLSYQFDSRFLVRTNWRSGNYLRNADLLEGLDFCLAISRCSAYGESIYHLFSDKSVQSREVAFCDGIADILLCTTSIPCLSRTVSGEPATMNATTTFAAPFAFSASLWIE